jgi:thymidine kinase
MAKLYFKYGVVGSAKTLDLLATAHSYRQQGKKVDVVKPAIDTRFGERTVKSRAGLETEADFIIQQDQTMFGWHEDADIILVDEVQFLSTEIIKCMRRATYTGSPPIICYGLRTDFRKEPFPASALLLSIADVIDEIKTTCFYCRQKAVFNLKMIDGIPTIEGNSVELGCEEKYLPVCASHWELAFK